MAEDPVYSAKRLYEETVELAKKIYGRRWMKAVEELEEYYEGDPFAVLTHLRELARKSGMISGSKV